MPVIMKDEEKYAGCVGILDQLEKWTQDIYFAAGLCQFKPAPTDASVPIIEYISKADQSASHA